MTIALRPCPTSICKSPGVSAKPPSAHRLFVTIEVYNIDLCQCVSPRTSLSRRVSRSPIGAHLFAETTKDTFSFVCSLEPSCIGGGRLMCSSYLTRRDELQRPEGSLHVRDVGLELVESSGDARLDLIGLGPRRAVGRDLVQCLLRHVGRLTISVDTAREAEVRDNMRAKFMKPAKIGSGVGGKTFRRKPCTDAHPHLHSTMTTNLSISPSFSLGKQNESELQINIIIRNMYCVR